MISYRKADKYKKLLFKPTISIDDEEDLLELPETKKKNKKKKGGQKGHDGHFCKKQKKIDQKKTEVTSYEIEEHVLVRDDYAGYKKLKFQHQSCWAHLLRISHDVANDKKASEEVKKFTYLLKKYV